MALPMHLTIRRKLQPRRRKLLTTLLLVVSAILVGTVPLAVVRGSDSELSQTFATPADEINVSQPQSANGVDLTLNSVALTGASTRLTFVLALPAEALPDRDGQVLKPMVMDTHVRASNVDALPGGLVLESSPSEKNQALASFTLVLGPIVDASQPVMIEFVEIPLASTGSLTILEGPWQFDLDPDVLTADQPSRSTVVHSTTQDEGISVTVDRLEDRPSGLHIYYTIHSDVDERIIPATNDVKLVFEDGSHTPGTAMQPINTAGLAVDANAEKQFVSIFPRLKSDVSLSATLTLGPFVQSISTSNTITINDPFGDWTADPVSIHGDLVEVVHVQGDSNGILGVTVRNQESTGAAEVMFLGTDVDEVSAKDSDGRTYSWTAGGTGLQRTEAGEIGAGRSDFIFNDVDPTVNQFTISVSQSSALVRGRWHVPVSLP